MNFSYPHHASIPPSTIYTTHLNSTITPISIHLNHALPYTLTNNQHINKAMQSNAHNIISNRIISHIANVYILTGNKTAESSMVAIFIIVQGDFHDCSRLSTLSTELSVDICDMADTADVSERRFAWREESSSWALVWAWRSLDVRSLVHC